MPLLAALCAIALFYLLMCVDKVVLCDAAQHCTILQTYNKGSHVIIFCKILQDSIGFDDFLQESVKFSRVLDYICHGQLD